MNNKHTNTKKIRLLALLCAVVLPACQSQGAAPASTPSASPAAAQAQVLAEPVPVSYSKDDENIDWKAASPNYIELSAAGADIKGAGAAAKDRTLTINAAGTYVLSGIWDGGQIVVDAPKEDKVWLVLNGVEITSKVSAAIYVKQADKTIVTLQEGTKNTVTDAAKYTVVDSSTDEPNAAIYSKDDLTINGTGALTVRGNYNNGVTSKDDLRITGGAITVSAADDGIMGKDLVAFKAGTILIEAAGDGIKSTNDTEAAKGIIHVDGGTFQIKAGKDGMQAAASVQVNGGTFAISSGGGSASAAAKSEAGGGMKGDMPGGMKGGFPGQAEGGAPGGTNGEGGARADKPVTSEAANQPKSSAQSDDAAAETASGKAVKAGTAIAIAKGTFSIDSADDAIHSNQSIAIAGGDFSIASGDDGIHADSSILISGGKIQITKSYEGIESSDITLAGGEIHVTASDDGINIGGGADGSSTNGRAGQNKLNSSSAGNKLTITGGSIYVNASGDGLDSNGSILMSGGTVYVNGPTMNGNGALDYDGSFELTGGLLVAAGSAGMAQAPSDSSTQSSILMTYPQAQKAGTKVELKDKNGKTLASYTPEKSFQTIVIGSPELTKDTAYSLYTGEAKTVDFTASGAVTWLNENGVTTARSSGPGGFGGGPGGGGNPGEPGGKRGPAEMSRP
ncbi:carbohydrate-binding domain-containing protein [Paenibacillus lutrae]|uniref:Carbohydrate-binding domain-containing protein n=1 Tax=Paenibacillus lutrae TaxID=2078573 RepID=A0A7X3FKH8_9BACL|nr:carbohydrate-binding domain-containing protein [Paenibacillus lutrae]MVP01278.1 carbohydrate-binding domain-containing protein [Paenibacillus lutrae]